MFNKLLGFQSFAAVMSSLGVWLVGHGQLDPGASTTLIGYAVAAGGLVLAGYVAVRLRPALPRGEAGQTVGDYLATPANVGAATHAWILIGGAGVMCWLGFATTGIWADALVGAIALVLYVTLRPSALARQ
jgi:hypothetical protein